MAAVVVLFAIAIACATVYLALFLWDRLQSARNARHDRRRLEEEGLSRERYWRAEDARMRELERRARLRDE